MNNVNRSLWIIVFIVVILLADCNNDTKTDPKCECPTGTEHLPGQTGNCNSMTNGCDCTVISGTTIQGIPVTNRNNAVTAETFNRICDEGISEALAEVPPEYITLFKNHVREVAVVTGLGSPSYSSGVVTIKENGWSKGGIQMAFWDSIL